MALLAAGKDFGSLVGWCSGYHFVVLGPKDRDCNNDGPHYNRQEEQAIKVSEHSFHLTDRDADLPSVCPLF